MHELALAQAVVDTALDIARREGIGRITRLRVRIGELQRIRESSFEFALREVIPAVEPALADVSVELETEPARFRCRGCERAFGLGEARGSPGPVESESIHFVPELAHAFLRCPDCDGADFEVVAGRGVVLQELEGE